MHRTVQPLILAMAILAGVVVGGFSRPALAQSVTGSEITLTNRVLELDGKGGYMELPGTNCTSIPPSSTRIWRTAS